jgi:putative ABC transport system permease protein
MALGATRSDVLRLVLAQSSRLVLAGIALGISGAAVGVHMLDSLLYGVQAIDPPTFVAVPVLLALVALAAALVPARRAALVDPIIAMRGD